MDEKKKIEKLQRFNISISKSPSVSPSVNGEWCYKDDVESLEEKYNTLCDDYNALLNSINNDSLAAHLKEVITSRDNMLSVLETIQGSYRHFMGYEVDHWIDKLVSETLDKEKEKYNG